MTTTHIYRANDFYRQPYIDEDDPILEELAAFRLRVLDNGYETLPVRGKNGLLSGWTSGEITPERVRYETSIGTTKLNTGIRCGRVAVPDNDVKNPEHAAAVNELIEHFLGTSPLKRRGSKGAAYCYYNRTPIKKLTLTDANYTRLFEILGDGQQFVAYGKHPDGMDYTWIGEGEPATVPLTELPEVTPEQLIELHAAIRELLIALGYQFKADEPRVDNPESANTTRDNADEDIPALCRAALAVIPNDCDREEWVKICYAIRDAGLNFGDWQEFCDKWHRQHKRGSVEAAWDSCASPRSVTFRTLLEKADKADPEWRSRYYAPINKAKSDAFWEVEMRRIREEMNFGCGEPEFLDDEPEFDNEPEEPQPEPQPDPPPRKRTWVFFDEYENLPAPEYWDDNGEHGFLINMPDGSVMLVTGKWGSHKTNVITKIVLDAVMDKGARALYVVCEGAYLYGQQRMPKFCKARGIAVRELRGRFHFADKGIDLTNEKAVLAMIEDNLDFMPNIIIIDTLAQATPGLESNDKAMGDLLGNSGPVAAIRRTFDALVIVLAHPPKTARLTDEDISGHGSIIGNTDAIAGSKYDKKQRIVTWEMKRNKNGPEGLKLWFSIPEYGFPIPEQLSEDPYGDPEEAQKVQDYDSAQASVIRGILALAVADDYETGFTNRQMAEKLWASQAWDDPNKPKTGDKDEWVSAKEKELSNCQQRKMQAESPYFNMTRCIVKGKMTFRRWCWTGEMLRHKPQE
jgi:Primase C terminal 2 (PriCT-2)/AAA domain